MFRYQIFTAVKSTKINNVNIYDSLNNQVVDFKECTTKSNSYKYNWELHNVLLLLTLLITSIILLLLNALYNSSLRIKGLFFTVKN